MPRRLKLARRPRIQNPLLPRRPIPRLYCAGDALDPPVMESPNKTLSRSLSPLARSLARSLARARSRALSLSHLVSSCAREGKEDSG